MWCAYRRFNAPMEHAPHMRTDAWMRMKDLCARWRTRARREVLLCGVFRMSTYESPVSWAVHEFIPVAKNARRTKLSESRDAVVSLCCSFPGMLTLVGALAREDDRKRSAPFHQMMEGRVWFRLLRSLGAPRGQPVWSSDFGWGRGAVRCIASARASFSLMRSSSRGCSSSISVSVSVPFSQARFIG